MPLNQTWDEWYDEVRTGLVSAIESAVVEWASRADGTPWVFFGQRRPRGIEYPFASVYRFEKTRDDANSMRGNELHRISSQIYTYREGDSTTPEKNLRAANADKAAIEDALYSDRSLGGSCDQLIIDSSEAFENSAASGHESVASIELTITKHAHLSQ